MSNKLVLFTDGSCRDNPGFGGFGIYGYLYSESNKPKNYKHPYHSTLYFTPTGIQRVKSDLTIEVHNIIEIIYALGNDKSTNNEAELKALVTGLKKANEIKNLISVKIYTDSNYIVQAFNDNLNNWVKNNWKRVDGKNITHIFEWSKVIQYRDSLNEMGCSVTVEWVKGHTDNKDENYSYGNNMSDIYSVIGSNYARINKQNQDTVVLDNIINYTDYKQSYENKDFVYYFKDMYFTSDNLDDKNYCFISTSDDPALFGKRNNASIFVTNIGYVPPVINQIKAFYRKIQRDYITTCCLKICKFENKDINRITEYIDIQYMLLPITTQPRTYSIIGEKTPFLYDNIINFPFIINAAEMFSKMTFIDSSINDINTTLIKFDVTDTFIDLNEHKLKLTNKDKDIDFTDLVKDRIEFKQKLIIKLSYDIPSYLAMKNIEKEIEKIYLIIETNDDNNYGTVYINIVTKSRNIYSSNIENKYLRKIK